MAAPPAWLRAAGPALTPAAALARIADEPSVAMLHGGGLGWSYLTWGGAVERCGSLAELAARLPIATEADAPIPQTGSPSAWSGAFNGGWILQADYEFPASAARLWRVDALVAWDPAGTCTLHASDSTGLARMHAGLTRMPQPLTAPSLAGALAPAWDAAGHRARVERIRAYIAAGDIYQANLTVPFTARLADGTHRDLGLFLALVAASPAPYAALLRDGGRSVVSHSPECFLRLRGRAAASEPIKGTRRRVAGGEDAARNDLLASAKDRAELAMIVDLVRNDLGRVAEPGSVRVADAARVMDLPYVHHLVARVEARLRAGSGAAELIDAAFPAGSITGAPKLRAMRIIRELEHGPRGPYCGTFGWLGRDGAAELAVAIRTLVVEDGGVRLDVGGGIVADSDPAAEWDEARAKASAMAAALGAQV